MESHRSYDRIIQQPLAKLRQQVATSFRRGTLEADFNTLAQQIQDYIASTNPDEALSFTGEVAKARQAIDRWQVLDEPDLSTPEKQLLWGATLGLSMMKWTEQVRHMEPDANQLWQRLQSNDVVEEERRFCAQSAAVIPGLRERQGQLKVEWALPREGYPAQGFLCDPVTGTLKLDLAWALIMGVEPARSVLQREAAYGIGTLFFTPEMQRTRTEMMRIKDKEKRTPEEHDRMLRLAAQWLARYDVTVGAESNFAHHFAAERAKVSAQDYGSSINYAETVAGGIPDFALLQKQIESRPAGTEVPAKLQLQNLQRALSYSFFASNSLFENTEAGWKSMGVDPSLIQTSDGVKRGMDALNELQDMALEMAKLQPTLRDRMSGDVYYAKQMEESSLARCLVADKIFDRFAKQLIPALELEAEQNPFETMDRIDKMLGEPKDKKPGEDREPGEPGEGEEGEPDDKSAEVEGKGKQPDTRVPPKNPREAKGMGEEEGDPMKDLEGEPQPGEGEGEGEPGEGEGEPGEGEGEPGEGEPGDGEGEGEPQEGEGDGELTESEEKKLKELLEEMKGEGGREHGSTWNDNKPDDVDDTGNLNEYLKIINPHRPVIAQASGVMKKIQEKLTVRIQDPSVSHSLVPDDGDVSRFNPDQLKSRLIKQFSGQSIDESDFENFRVDGPIRTLPAKSEIHIMIDGSGSMSGQPVEMAMTAGCILYEAAREAGIDVYITMLGDPHPIPIAKPGQTDKEIGRTIANVRRGQGGDKDYLSPSLADMITNTLGQRKDLMSPVGNTHVFVVSDGRFTDESLAIDHVKQINEHCPHVSMDYILINGDKSLQIEQTADALNRGSARSMIGYKEIRGPGEISDALMELLNNRLKSVRAEDAIPLKQKQKEFKNVKLKDQYRRGMR